MNVFSRRLFLLLFVASDWRAFLFFCCAHLDVHHFYSCRLLCCICFFDNDAVVLFPRLSYDNEPERQRKKRVRKFKAKSALRCNTMAFNSLQYFLLLIYIDTLLDFSLFFSAKASTTTSSWMLGNEIALASSEHIPFSYWATVRTDVVFSDAVISLFSSSCFFLSCFTERSDCDALIHILRPFSYVRSIVWKILRCRKAASTVIRF